MQKEYEISIIMEPLLNAKDVKVILRCSLPLVYKLAGDQIPCVRWKCPGNGRPKSVLRFKKQDVLNFIEDNYGTQAKN